MSRQIWTALCMILLVLCLTACTSDSAMGQVKRTDSYTLNSERRDLEERIKNNRDSFQQTMPEKYTLTATVNVSHEADGDRITYDVLVNDAQIPLANVIQSFTLAPAMMKVIDAPDLLNTNTSNDYETNLEPNKEPLGLSLGRSYVLKPRTDINRSALTDYQDMYIKISYGSDDERTEDYFYIQAEPSIEAQAYMESISNE
ncbi:hypothetical protein J2W91_001497 [Paenibacillus amylolyticus]|uniref:Lipoprotein n=1 Tax=Paenibacillus amylolyticus TaxID=1451 RepID=A0AAP5GYM9_PAEAM|nr:hypothetical protein [Paenibacillus amylolyticus]MDR6723045.1 hypothetical protein [Paenibacillus amylolyticus]